MAKLPHINKMKFGIIDADYMNTLATRTDEFEDMKTALQQLVGTDKNRGTKGFLAFLSKSEVIATGTGNKPIAWKYDWFRCDFNALPRLLGGYESSCVAGDGIYTETNYKFADDPNKGKPYNQSTSEELRLTIDPIDGYPYQDSEYQCYAYNLAELTNIITAPIICGIDVSAEGYPKEYRLQEASGFVWLTQIRDACQGNLHYFFERMGIHDGECDT